VKNIFIISGTALKQARRAKEGLTQQNVADSLGIERTTYTNWEGKKKLEITAKQMETIKKVLGVAEHVLTNVSHETGTSGQELELYKQLAIERMERIEELKEQVQSLKKELAECRSSGK
jgi:transcriptional regulator with XRE-family HTH domain